MKKLTAKNFKYTHYMTLEEWKQWKENFDAHNKKWNSIRTTKTFISDRVGSFKMIIDDAFSWHQTPQKSDYWKEIYGRTSPINQKICKK